MVWVLKPATTIAILLAAWRARPRGPGDDPQARAARGYAHGVLAGLACSLAGDVLLIPQGLFVWGLVAFLIAHLCYLYAFTRGVRLFAHRAPVLAVAAIAGVVLAVLWPRLPDALRGPVLAYVAMLGSMTAQAQVRARVLGDPGARLAAWGGALFLCSDALLAFDRFHTPIPWAGLWVLATYWAAQTLIAMSLRHGTRGKPRAERLDQ
jgi:uncharacterized membrane protein YhhN